MKNKREIRKEILEIRKGLGEKDVETMSRTICSIIQVTEIFRSAADLCIYMPINNEVDVTYLIEPARADKKRVWLPRVKGGRMEFCSYEEDTALIKGAFGIMEPDSEKRLTADSHTLVIMPGAVFSEKHDRIGYGGGYYDVFLEGNPQCKTIAACYGFQILPELPSEAHDVKPDVIVSEERVLMK